VLPVPTGAKVLDLLPALQQALAGGGDALLPIAADGPRPGLVRTWPAALGEGEDDADDPTALVVTTSGSSGASKGVLLPASALRASAAATRRRLGGPGAWLLALPGWHVAGIQVLLRAVADGTEPTVLDTGETFSPQRFAAAVATMAPTSSGRRYVSLVPTQLLRLLTGPAECLDALRSFDAVLVGGAATAPALLARARSHRVAVVTTYGMTETCGGCVYDGLPLDGVDIGLDPPDGRIVVTGPVVARGYLGRPADPAFPRTGVFRTADAGRWAGAQLDVLGRLDDLILTGGNTVAPQAVEAALAGRPGVAEVVVVGVPDEQWGELVTAAVVPAPDGPAPDLAQLQAADLPGHQRPRRLVLLDALPMSGPGKPDRRAVRRIAIERLGSQQ